MRLIGRLFIVFAALALAGWGVWTFVIGRGDMQQRMFERAAETRYQTAKPKPADAAVFRATICAGTPCVMVEAGGLSFLVGAGHGSAEGLEANGLLRADLDGVLLAGVTLEEIDGLADLPPMLAELGRQEPLPVYGPAGVERAVEGANTLLAAPIPKPPPPPLPTRGQPAPQQALTPPGPLTVGGNVSTAPEATLVFDSGVVTVKSFDVPGGEGASPDRIYRFDFDNRSLLIAGCRAKASDILNAARGAAQASLIVPAASGWMLEAERKAATAAGYKATLAGDGAGCLSPEDAIAAMQNAKLAGGLLAPLRPHPADMAGERLWRELVRLPASPRVGLGEPGTSLDLAKTGVTVSRNGKRIEGSGELLPALNLGAKPAAKPAAKEDLAPAQLRGKTDEKSPN
jgi:hypothetical protein